MCYKLINKNLKLFYNIFIVSIESVSIILFTLNSRIFNVVKV